MPKQSPLQLQRALPFQIQQMKRRIQTLLASQGSDVQSLITKYLLKYFFFCFKVQTTETTQFSTTTKTTETFKKSKSYTWLDYKLYPTWSGWDHRFNKWSEIFHVSFTNNLISLFLLFEASFVELNIIIFQKWTLCLWNSYFGFALSTSNCCKFAVFEEERTTEWRGRWEWE